MINLYSFIFYHKFLVQLILSQKLLPDRGLVQLHYFECCFYQTVVNIFYTLAQILLFLFHRINLPPLIHFCFDISIETKYLIIIIDDT